MNGRLTAYLIAAALQPSAGSADTPLGRDTALAACEAALEQQGIAPRDLAAVSIRPDGHGYSVKGKVVFDAGPDAKFTCSTDAGLVIDLRVGN